MVTWVRKAQVKEMLRRSGHCDGVRRHGGVVWDTALGSAPGLVPR
jgi:hypothetical protein